MHDSPVALVTGASRGIGRAIALELARQRYAIVVNYRQNADQAAEVVREIEQLGSTAIALCCDVGQVTQHEGLMANILERFGRIDALINNAGITSPGRLDLLDATTENWDLVLDTNLKGPFFLAQRVAREMIAHPQADAIRYLVNISSVSAYAVSLNRADYCIAKAALQMMTKLFAARLAEHDIRVYEVCPGVIETDMTQPVHAQYVERLQHGLAPIRRLGQPEEVGRAVAALVSGAFDYATGIRLQIDGGLHIQRL
jgi:NAD(P)-dependent dehydrogenase (short-subunit alcohol dehydrogenase family)